MSRFGAIKIGSPTVGRFGAPRVSDEELAAETAPANPWGSRRVPPEEQGAARRPPIQWDRLAAPRPKIQWGAIDLEPADAPATLREFVGPDVADTLTPESALEGGHVAQFLDHLRAKADKLTPDSPERVELARHISGLQSELADYQQQQRTAAARGVSRETSNRLDSPVGAFEQSLAQSTTGQAALRAEQGLSEIVGTALSAASRALGNRPLSQRLYRDKQARAEFLSAAESGGQTEQLLGKTGSRVFGNIVNNSAKFMAAGMAGPAAVLSLIAGESFDLKLAQREAEGGGDLGDVSDAINAATLETGLTYLFGQYGKRLGLDSLEEVVLSPGMRNAAANLATKVVPQSLRQRAGKALAGAGLEWAEENVVDLTTQALEVINGDRTSFDWDQAFEAGLTGGASRMAVGGVKEIADRLRKIPAQQIEETVRGVRAAEQASGVAVAADPPPAEPSAVPADTGAIDAPPAPVSDAPVADAPGVGPSPVLESPEDRAAFERIAAKTARVEDAAGARGLNRALEFIPKMAPAVLDQLRRPLSQKEFARVTGLKKTSQTFRAAFQETIDLYHRIDHRNEKETAVPAATEGLRSSNPSSSAADSSPAPSSVAPAAPAVPPPAETLATQSAPDAAAPPAEALAAVQAAAVPDAAAVAGSPAAEPSGPPFTSARRAMVDRDREAFGLPAVPDAESRSWAQALDTAVTNVAPGRALALATAVIQSPRAFSDVETAGLVLQAATIKNEHEAAISKIAGVTDPADIAVHAAELNRLESEFDTLTRALRISGTEKGRALAAQKLTIDKSYDLVSVLSRAKAAKGAALTPDERAKFEALVEKAKHNERYAYVADQFQQKYERERAHREVTRLRGAVNSIRKQLGLDASAPLSVDIPALTDSDRAAIAKLGERLREAEAALGTAEPDAAGRVHNRPSERPVSDLDDALARVRASLTRAARFGDGTAAEQNKIAALQRKLDAAYETLRQARAGEPIEQELSRKADVMSEQRDKLTYELQKTRQDIRDAIADAAPKTAWQRLQSWTDISRGLLTSTDYSAIGRQAKFAALSHPWIALKNVPHMFRAGWSDEKAYQIEQEILSRPNAPLYEASGLAISRRDATPTAREEAVAARILEKPIRIGGRDYWNPVAGSQRAYVTFLNKMRADVFDMLAKTHGGDLGLSREQYKELAHTINVFTGRGGIATAERHMRSAAVVLFAPRFLLSRIQFAVGEPAWRSSPEVRKIVAQEYARTFLGAAVWYSLYAAAFGDDPRFSLTFDPRSTDFGKIVLGNARIDPLAGLAQVTRFAARMLSGQTVDQYGRVKSLTPRDKWNETSRFTRSKLSPFLGQAANFATGADVMNNPIDLKSVEGATNLGLGLVVPLSVRDITSAMEDQGVARGTAISILGLMGEGIQIFEPKR